jgi:hypothetical protein
MPDELYRRCPECRELAFDAPCPTCGGARFIPAGITLGELASLADKAREVKRIVGSMCRGIAASHRSARRLRGSANGGR